MARASGPAPEGGFAEPLSNSRAIFLSASWSCGGEDRGRETRRRTGGTLGEKTRAPRCPR
eukprot:8242715-Pyramimonas_sp.AAC.1